MMQTTIELMLLWRINLKQLYKQTAEARAPKKQNCEVFWTIIIVTHEIVDNAVAGSMLPTFIWSLKNMAAHSLDMIKLEAF